MFKQIKKIWKSIVAFFFILTLSASVYAAAPVIVESLTNATPGSGEGYLEMQVRGQQVNAGSYIEWYAYNIAGYNSIDFYVTATSITTQNATTLSATPVYGDKVAVTGSQTITSGTDLTDLQASNYRFRYYSNEAVTANVTMNFLIAK